MKKLLLFSLVLLVLEANAQDKKKYIDPFKRPRIWKDLEKDPTDSSLWIQYVGKNWQDMTKDERYHVQDMKQMIMLEHLSEESDILGFSLKSNGKHRTPEGFFIDDFAYLDLMRFIEDEKLKDKKKKNKKRKKQHP